MFIYALKRLLLLPVTLFFIVLTNFVIINLAPGEPASFTEVGAGGEAGRRAGQSALFGSDERYLQFRQFFGLTLPILFNTWSSTTPQEVLETLEQLVSKKRDGQELSAKKYNDLRTEVGDKACFILPQLILLLNDTTLSEPIRRLALRFFLRGSRGFVTIGQNLSEQVKQENKRIERDNFYLDTVATRNLDDKKVFDETVTDLSLWFADHAKELHAMPTRKEKIAQFFFETRFSKYMWRVLNLDFGMTRQDPNKKVINEVIKRLKISLTLSVLPMMMTLFLCFFFGLFMAIYKDTLFDKSLNFILLLLYAAPVFVVAPLLIEKIALHQNYPFTDIPFPIRGFSSESSIYDTMTTAQRIMDIFRHITLPLLSILYGSLAIQARLARAVFIDTMNMEFVRAARAKGVHSLSLYIVHVASNAMIPMITSVAASLGVILGGSVIVETIFDIHGYGKFFYDAIIDRDYNVMMFSVFVGSFLSLVGYLLADFAYMWLDPRVSLENKR